MYFTLQYVPHFNCFPERAELSDRKFVAHRVFSLHAFFFYSNGLRLKRDRNLWPRNSSLIPAALFYLVNEVEALGQMGV